MWRAWASWRWDTSWARSRKWLADLWPRRTALRASAKLMSMIDSIRTKPCPINRWTAETVPDFPGSGSTLGLQEPDLRPLFGGVGQVPGIARQEHRLAVMVVGERAHITVDKAFQLH